MKKLALIILAILIPFSTYARDYDYRDLVDRVKDRFAQSMKLYEGGDQDAAQEVAQSAYFELFENLEGPIRINVSSKKSWDMERKFVKIRNLIKKGAPKDEINMVISSLNADMDEVLPKLEKGAVIVAERSNDNSAGNAAISADLDIRWQSLYDNINAKFDDAITSFRKGDKAKAKEFIRTAQFEDYRNGKVEIAIRTHISQSKDGQIQNEMRRIIMSIDSLDDVSLLQSDLQRLRTSIYLALNDLPSEAAQLAVVDVEIEEDETSSQNYFDVLASIKAEGDKAVEFYKDGDIKKAMNVIQNSYFDIFEASGMEVRIGAMDNALKLQIESIFNEVVAIMKNGGSLDKVEAALQKLYSEIEIGAEKLSTKTTPWSLFLYSLIIILREGVEALIVVAAVIAYLIKSGNSDRLNIVYSSLWTAIGLSFATAFVMNYLFNASGESRELLEGITMLVAVLLLFYVGFWLLSNAYAKKWARYISEKVKDSISGGSAKALWFTVFLAVYREGAETVLFYQAIIFDVKNALGYSMVATGLIVGLILLIILFFALKAGAVRIPIKPFFVITSAIIFYMSVVFAGKGVMELVEGKIIEPTIIEGLPTVTWLGLYPYVESLLPQIILILGIVAGSLLIRKKSSSGEKV